MCPLHVQRLRFPSTSQAMDQCRARACRYDSGAAIAVLGRRAVAPHLASSRDHDHCEYPEPGRIPQQLALTIGALAWCGPSDDLQSDLRVTDRWAGFPDASRLTTPAATATRPLMRRCSEPQTSSRISAQCARVGFPLFTR